MLHLDPQSIERNLFGWTKIVVDAELHCTYDSAVQKLSIKQVSPEKYLLSVVPQKRGKHVVCIKHGNTHICNSPIPIYITAEPKELVSFHKPEIKQLQKPAGIKFYDGKIYVSNIEEEIVVLDAYSMNTESKWI